MSLNAIHINVMVYSTSSKKAFEYMKKLVDSTGEDIVRENKTLGEIDTDKKRYQAMFASDGARGYRYTEVHVDRSLADTDVFHNVIIAKLVPFHYYAGKERDENYNWRDHVHYFN